MTSQQPLPMAGENLDRASVRRTDAVWLHARLGEPSTRVLAVAEDALPVAGDPPALVWTVADTLTAAARDRAVFLGVRRDGTAVFAVDATEEPEPEPASAAGPGLIPPPAPEPGSHADAERQAKRRQSPVPEPQPAAEPQAAPGRLPLREVAALLEPAEAGLAAHAVALLHWHRRHRFCPDCGAPSVPVEGGHARRCTRDGSYHHPRTDPCVIVLVEDGDRVLLGRRAGFPKRRYSVIAGFVEPGETLEAAVAREVQEETGVTVVPGSARYVASQPWPFPASLMLGFRAVAATTDQRPADGELEDVRWMQRDELRTAVGRGDILLPPPASIAHHLLTGWLDGG